MEAKDFIQIEEFIKGEFIDAVISNSSKPECLKKVKIRPVMIGNEEKYQITEYKGTKVIHQNNTRYELMNRMEQYISGYEVKNENGISNNVKFKQIVIRNVLQQMNILISKKGKSTIKIIPQKEKLVKEDRAHNRTKQYILQEGIPVPFLIDLNIMTKCGKVIRSKYDKYRQINRFLEFVEDVCDELPSDREISILDFGCGKSYLTFALYYYLKVLKGFDIKITGLDIKPDVIRTCSELAKKYHYDKLEFINGDIAGYDKVNKTDMVVTLHACNTATDYAIHKAVQWGAKVILSVPCCQHELNQQISCDILEPIFQYGLLKERMAALITDGLRAQLLECVGYKTQVLEFINMEHTPKNILIRAVKQQDGPMCDNRKYKELVKFLNVTPTLGELLKQNL